MITPPSSATEATALLLFTAGAFSNTAAHPLWVYTDANGDLQGPFGVQQMMQWFKDAKLPGTLLLCGITPDVAALLPQIRGSGGLGLPQGLFHSLDRLMGLSAAGLQYSPVTLASLYQTHTGSSGGAGAGATPRLGQGRRGSTPHQPSRGVTPSALNRPPPLGAGIAGPPQVLLPMAGGFSAALQAPAAQQLLEAHPGLQQLVPGPHLAPPQLLSLQGGVLSLPPSDASLLSGVGQPNAPQLLLPVLQPGAGAQGIQHLGMQPPLQALSPMAPGQQVALYQGGAVAHMLPVAGLGQQGGHPASLDYGQGGGAHSAYRQPLAQGQGGPSMLQAPGQAAPSTLQAAPQLQALRSGSGHGLPPVAGADGAGGAAQPDGFPRGDAGLGLGHAWSVSSSGGMQQLGSLAALTEADGRGDGAQLQILGDQRLLQQQQQQQLVFGDGLLSRQQVHHQHLLPPPQALQQQQQQQALLAHGVAAPPAQQQAQATLLAPAGTDMSSLLAQLPPQLPGNERGA